jgi:hypothetical protein
MKIFKNKLSDILKMYKASVDSTYFLLIQKFSINLKFVNLEKFHAMGVHNLILLKNILRTLIFQEILNGLLIKLTVSILKVRVGFKIVNKLVLKSLTLFKKSRKNKKVEE